jgi:hypothetical protein
MMLRIFLAASYLFRNWRAVRPSLETTCTPELSQFAQQDILINMKVLLTLYIYFLYEPTVPSQFPIHKYCCGFMKT